VIVWRLGPGLWFPGLRLRVLATDVDPEGLARARRGWYSRSSLKDLPPAYLEQAFAPIGQGWGLGEVYRDAVTFAEQDIRWFPGGARGRQGCVLRHPMPYGDLERQRVRRFAR